MAMGALGSSGSPHSGGLPQTDTRVSPVSGGCPATPPQGPAPCPPTCSRAFLPCSPWSPSSSPCSTAASQDAKPSWDRLLQPPPRLLQPRTDTSSTQQTATQQEVVANQSKRRADRTGDGSSLHKAVLEPALSPRASPPRTPPSGHHYSKKSAQQAQANMERKQHRLTHKDSSENNFPTSSLYCHKFLKLS